MTVSKLTTYFAPAELSSAEELEKQKDLFVSDKIFAKLLDSTPDYLVVLNSNRQIVFANKSAKELIRATSENNLFGLRPGEILNCQHVSEPGSSGCGTTEFCRTCGAVKAVLSSLKGTEDVQECRIIQAGTNEALDLRVWTRPLEVNGQRFSIFTFSDISNEKRRMALERIFFHDVLNTAGGIKSLVNLLRTATEEEIEEYQDIAQYLIEELINEIKSQRDLMLAESGELEINLGKCNSQKIIADLSTLYQKLRLADNKKILVDTKSDAVDFISDFTLIFRVVSNMLKNAIEASAKGDIISIGCSLINDDTVRFYVHNNIFIPKDIQNQIFQRSFSTKGKGRGLGTYSMKLLSGRYLKGKVYFESSESKGTTFFAEYPVSFNKKNNQ